VDVFLGTQCINQEKIRIHSYADTAHVKILKYTEILYRYKYNYEFCW